MTIQLAYVSPVTRYTVRLTLQNERHDYLNAPPLSDLDFLLLPPVTCDMRTDDTIIDGLHLPSKLS